MRTTTRQSRSQSGIFEYSQVSSSPVAATCGETHLSSAAHNSLTLSPESAALVGGSNAHVFQLCANDERRGSNAVRYGIGSVGSFRGGGWRTTDSRQRQNGLSFCSPVGRVGIDAGGTGLTGSRRDPANDKQSGPGGENPGRGGKGDGDD